MLLGSFACDVLPYVMHQLSLRVISWFAPSISFSRGRAHVDHCFDCSCRRASTLSVRVIECDAANSNMKLVAYMMNHCARGERADGVLFHHVLCSNHQTHLAVVSALTQCSGTLGSDVFLTNMFVSTHWLRLHQGLKPFLDHTLDVVYRDDRSHQQVVEAGLFSREVTSFLIRTTRGFTDSASDSADSDGAAGRRALAQRVDDLLAMRDSAGYRPIHRRVLVSPTVSLCYPSQFVFIHVALDLACCNFGSRARYPPRPPPHAPTTSLHARRDVDHCVGG